MTPKENLQEIKKIAQDFRNALLALGAKASVIYQLEKIIKLCDTGATDEDVDTVDRMMKELQHGSDQSSWPN